MSGKPDRDTGLEGRVIDEFVSPAVQVKVPAGYAVGNAQQVMGDPGAMSK